MTDPEQLAREALAEASPQDETGEYVGRREAALATEVLRLRAWLLDITDAIPGGWPPGTEPPA